MTAGAANATQLRYYTASIFLIITRAFLSSPVLQASSGSPTEKHEEV